jgi:omega-6 fatty acid desaturase (delta-12 desaturase)
MSTSTDFEKEIVLALRPFGAKSLRKAWIQMLTSFGPYVVLWSLAWVLWEMSWIGSVMIMMLNAFFLVRIFIIQHDCGHHSFFDPKRHKRVQVFVGWLCSVFSTLPFRYWSAVHHYHHVHTGQLEERDIGDLYFMTVDEYSRASRFRRGQYRLFRHPVVLFGVVPIVYFLWNNRWPFFFSQNIMSWRIRWSQMFNNLLILLVYAGGVWLLGWKFLVIQGVTLGFFTIIALWFFYVQHAHEKTYQRWRERGEWSFLPAALYGASRYDLPPVLHWLTGNIGYHHIHHLNPAIASYNLLAADKATYSAIAHVVQNLSFRESLDCLRNHLWDEGQERYLSFDEYEKTKYLQS